jgi:hypothetical protein
LYGETVVKINETNFYRVNHTVKTAANWTTLDEIGKNLPKLNLSEVMLNNSNQFEEIT